MLINGAQIVPISGCALCLSSTGIALDDTQHQYVDLGSTSIGGDFTAMAWVYLRKSITDQRLFSFSNSASNNGDHVDMYFGGNNAPRFHFRNNNDLVLLYETNHLLTLNTWTHVVLAFDNTAIMFKVYINGLLVATSPQATVPLPTKTRSVAFLGRDSYNGLTYSNMIFTDFKWYNQALTYAEIGNEYTGGVAYSLDMHPLAGMSILSDIEYSNVCTNCSTCASTQFEQSPCTLYQDTSCAPCPANHACDGTASFVQCNLCEPGTVEENSCTTTQQTVCSPCPSGRWCDSGVAYDCPMYATSPVGSNVQTNCTCVPGYYAALNATTCSYCPANHFCSGGSQMQACHDHALSAMGSNHSSACTCDRGYYESGPDTCTLCPADTWCWDSVKNDCPANSHSPAGVSWPENCTCNAGFERPEGSGECVSCLSGFYRDWTSLPETCQACINSVSVANATTCECKKGWMPTNATIAPKDGGCDACNLTAKYYKKTVDMPTVAMGETFGCILADGKVLCWGDGDYQIIPNTVSKPVPVESPVLLDFATSEPVVSVQAQYRHACVCFADGRGKCWGKNTDGNLFAAGATEYASDHAYFVSMPEGQKCERAVAGIRHSCFLTESKKLKCGGNNQFLTGTHSTYVWATDFLDLRVAQNIIQQYTVMDVQSISSAVHMLLRLADGTPCITGFGYNEYQHLQKGLETSNRNEMQNCNTLLMYFGQESIGDFNATKLSRLVGAKGNRGGKQMCAIDTVRGKTRCWGADYVGGVTLAFQSATVFGQATGPKPFLDFGEPFHVVDVITGPMHACAMSREGKLRCWGRVPASLWAYDAGLSSSANELVLSSISNLDTVYMAGDQSNPPVTTAVGVFANFAIKTWGDAFPGIPEHTQATGDSIPFVSLGVESQMCVVCPSDHYCGDEQAGPIPCEICTPGTIEVSACSHETPGSCLACPVDSNYWCDGYHVSNCTSICPDEDMYISQPCNASADTICGVCDSNYWCNRTHAVQCTTPCQPGMYQTISCTSTHDRQCEPCAANSWCVNGVSNVCPLHSASLRMSSTQQECLCDPGYYGPAGGLCQECTVDHWCPGGGGVFTCPNNSFSLHMGANASTDCICDPGFHQTNTTDTGP
eukprot:847657-Rhodomonas_salina.1